MKLSLLLIAIFTKFSLLQALNSSWIKEKPPELAPRRRQETSAIADRQLEYRAKDCQDLWGIPFGGCIHNLPLLQGVYCYNDGTGLCKALAGRFEFYLNTFEDKYLGPVKSNYSNNYGYHERVPISYNIDGEVNYADRSINWSQDFKKAINEQHKSLLSATSFNWCAYVKEGYWPYKSAFKDAKSKGRFHVYFHNRQSCIYDADTKKFQHFNTRFLGNSSLRIDIDMNPIIFAMEDHVAKDIRLVKNKRQHWYEVDYEVLVNPRSDIRYFVNMADTERPPLKLTKGPILSAKAYQNYSKVCLDDKTHTRRGKNAQLVPAHCGTDELEIVDYSLPQWKYNKGELTEVSIHNVPRWPKTSESFYGIDIPDDNAWEIFAKDGYTFSATTTIPIKGSPNSVTVISLHSDYRIYASDNYNEYYPMPFLSIYTSTYRVINGQGVWAPDNYGRKGGKKLKNLNYVDDIAYLYGCDTILVIYGPLYTELPPNKFSIETEAQIGSIMDLGIWEMANAFFAMPDGSGALWVAHRVNYIAEYKYKCASDSGSLVTAQRNGKYYPRYGLGTPSWFRNTYNGQYPNFNTYEETLFQKLGVFQGDNRSPEAPDPRLYPISNRMEPAGPAAVKSNLAIYIIVAVAVLLVIALFIICLATMRRRRKEQERKRQRSSLIPGTSRSSRLTSGMSQAMTPRSQLTSSLRGPSRTARSNMRSRSASNPSITMRSRSPSVRSSRPSVTTRSPITEPTFTRGGISRATFTPRSPLSKRMESGSQSKSRSHSKSSSAKRSMSLPRSSKRTSIKRLP